METKPSQQPSSAGMEDDTVIPMETYPQKDNVVTPSVPDEDINTPREHDGDAPHQSPREQIAQAEEVCLEPVLDSVEQLIDSWLPKTGRKSDGKSVSLDMQMLMDRLDIEWSMRVLTPQVLSFTGLVVIFLFNLLNVVPTGDVYNINVNMKEQFELEEISAINTYTGMYKYMYNFISTMDRFDPLNNERYVVRTYKNESGSDMGRTFVPSSSWVEAGQGDLGLSHGIELVQQKRFYTTTAVIVRPQIWMRRSNRVACKYFGTVYDKIYAMSRYTRGLYRGRKIEDGWQPAQVVYRDDEDSREVESHIIVKRSTANSQGGLNPPPPKSVLTADASKNGWGSYLLMCVDRAEPNRTMRTKLEKQFGASEITLDDETFFGDFFPETTDVMAYMGYKVYDADIKENEAEYPRCFMADQKNATTGNVIDTGVTMDDVEERCGWSPDTFHDVQTSEIRLQTILYTPVIEMFTAVVVSFQATHSGNMETSYELNTFQFLPETGRYWSWIACTYFQLFFSFFQFGLIMQRVTLERWAAKEFWLAERFTSGEKGMVVMAITLQSLFIMFYIRQLLAIGSQDTWNAFENFASSNPFNENGKEAIVQTQSAIFMASKKFNGDRMWGFFLIVLSFVQIINYLQVHPQLGVVAETILFALGDLMSFTFVSALLMSLLAVTGYWAFGADLEEFHSLPSACGMTFFLGISGGEVLAMQSKYDDNLKKLLVVLWELLVAMVVFFFLLNFLLAIVVDGYAAVKEKINVGASGNFVRDFIITIKSQRLYVKRSWPYRPAIVHYLRLTFGDDGEILDKKEVSAADIAPLWNDTGKDGLAEAEGLLQFYNDWCPALAVKEDAEARAQERSEAQEQAREAAIWEIKECTKNSNDNIKALHDKVELMTTQQLALQQANEEYKQETLRYQKLCENQMATVQALMEKGISKEHLEALQSSMHEKFQDGGGSSKDPRIDRLEALCHDIYSELKSLKSASPRESVEVAVRHLSDGSVAHSPRSPRKTFTNPLLSKMTRRDADPRKGAEEHRYAAILRPVHPSERAP